MAHPTDPMTKIYPMPSHKVSKNNFVVAGILCAVYGLEELPPQGKNVSCLYLLHARGNTLESMERIAECAISDWNDRLKNGKIAPSQQNTGLIAVCLDQRNHGTREVDTLRNEAWRTGNPNHGLDMFSIANGTARDVSNIIDFLGGYIFSTGDRQITDNLVLGISLGGHAAWHCALHEPRIRAAVIIIGSPDYTTLMSDRARRSKLASWKESDPPGSQFLGSKDFPQSLMDQLKTWDPAALLLGQIGSAALKGPILTGPIREPTEAEKQALLPIMNRCFSGKTILNIAGGSDKLVPYSCGEPFLTWLKKAIAPGGWFTGANFSLEDIIFDGAGHEVTPAMVAEAIRFIGETLSVPDEQSRMEGARLAKI